MVRTTASHVSALSGCVANGRQSMHHVSSALSTIPYGGFSPVRLQAGVRPRPSRRHTPPLIRGPSRSSGPSCPCRLCVRRHRPIRRRFQPRGPWLAGGLCCPARSSLTMASSEALGLSRRLSFAVVCGPVPSAAEVQSVPAFICVSFLPCRLPYPGGPDGTDCWALPSTMAFAYFGKARRPHLSTQKSVHAWWLFRGCKVRFMLRPGRLLALHRQRLLLSSFHPMSRLIGTSSMTTRAYSQFPRPDFHRLDTQPCRLRPKQTHVH